MGRGWRGRARIPGPGDWQRVCTSLQESDVSIERIAEVSGFSKKYVLQVNQKEKIRPSRYRKRAVV